MFEETPWPFIDCRRDQTEPNKREALAAFCRIYWAPIYRVLRERGVQREEAEDLTQAFLLHFIRRDSLTRADRSKGRFRNFLLGALDHYLADVRKSALRRKRGDAVTHVSLDDSAIRERDIMSSEMTQRQDRAWAASVVIKAVVKLQLEYFAAGRGELYRALKSHWCGDEAAVPYQALSMSLGRSCATLRSDVRRIRCRFAELLRNELRAEVGETRLSQELENLRQILCG